MIKRCSKCGKRKPLGSFYRAKTGNQGRRAECKQCAEKVRRRRTGARQRGPRPETGLRRCGCCRQVKPLAEFYTDKRYRWEHRCKACARERRKRSYAGDPERYRRKVREWYAANRKIRRPIGEHDAQRFWAQVQPCAEDECWSWRGSRVPSGYGQFSVGAHGYRAHRLAFELTVGPLDRGAAIAHRCRNRACCNPAHMVVGYDGKGLSAEERFWRNVERGSGCWLWRGGVDQEGYGQIKVDGRQERASRFAYRLLVGSIPTDHVVHLRCGEPACVNPAHLQATPTSELAGLLERDLPTHCPRGHGFGEEPPRRSDGSRRCLACERVWAAGRRAKIRNVWIEEVDPLIVLELADGQCGICGNDVDPFDFDVDHIMPLSRGGEHSYSNTQPAHPLCNRRKGGQLLEEV